MVGYGVARRALDWITRWLLTDPVPEYGVFARIDIYWEDDFGQRLYNVHDPEECAGNHCAIHNPSDHNLRHLPLRWRQAGPFDIKPSHFERVCEHEIGHPDPDSIAFLKSVGEEGMGVHGCCGCCRQ